MVFPRQGALKSESGLAKSWARVDKVSDSLQPHGLEPTRLLRLWNFPGKSTGVGCHFLLKRIFPTRELAPTCSKILPHKQLPFLRPPLQGAPPPSPLTCSSLFHHNEEKNLPPDLMSPTLPSALPPLSSSRPSRIHCLNSLSLP